MICVLNLVENIHKTTSMMIFFVSLRMQILVF